MLFYLASRNLIVNISTKLDVEGGNLPCKILFLLTTQYDVLSIRNNAIAEGSYIKVERRKNYIKGGKMVMNL